MTLEELAQLDQKVLRFKTAENVLRELRNDYRSLEAVINPTIAIVIANREKMERRINDLEKE